MTTKTPSRQPCARSFTSCSTVDRFSITLWRLLRKAERDYRRKWMSCGAFTRLLLRTIVQPVSHAFWKFLTKFHNRQVSSATKFQLKFLVTSRPYQDIELEFRDVLEPQTIRLAGEESNADISFCHNHIGPICGSTSLSTRLKKAINGPRRHF